MIYPRFAYIPQPVFTDQRDSERIFVIARRHIISFLSPIIIISLLVLIPVIVFATLGGSIITFIQSGEAYWTDIFIIGAMVYILTLLMVFMSSWVGFYYNLLIVTDERMIEITQRGLFNRESYELTYEQVEDVTLHTHGLLATLFNVGDIEIQTAGSQRNFVINTIPKPQIVWAAIHDLEGQTKSGVKPRQRIPSGEFIGLIGMVPLLRSAEIPPIANFRGGLEAARKKSISGRARPKSLRQKLDRWWWSHMKREQVPYLDYQSQEFKQERKKEEEQWEKSKNEMIDL